MATKSNSPGLLSKMTQFLRAPGKGPAEAGESVQSADSVLEKQALRERIAQRRQDDLVRRREFNHLRQIRAMSPQGLVSGVPRPSVFTNSSGFSHEELTPQERARTVSKIDAIEANMAEHWAQRKRQDTARPGSAATPAAPAPAPPPAPAAKPHSFGDELESEMDLDFTGLLSSDHAATEPAAIAPAVPVPAPAPVPARPSAPPPVLRDEATPSDFSSSFSNSRLTSEELGDDLNPALQEAAIRFADGDDAGAEAALLPVVQASDTPAEVAEACASALLDLYRAIDQPASFEVIAIEYAQRFGRSAPEWFSVPERLHRATGPAPLAPASAAPTAGWTCPAELTTAAVADLRKSQQGAGARHVQWDLLRSVQPGAVRALADLFTEWAGMPLDLHFSGEAVLNQVLLTATPSEARDTDPLWWHLRLEALRIQGLHDDFESVALDYCVTYEVSPPSWLEADCTCVHETQHTAPADLAAGPDTEFPPLDDGTPVQTLLELRGEIRGDATDTLQALRASLRPGEPMVISCAHLVRVDFAAAGSILNWLTAHKAETGPVQFVHLSRLVAAFFQVMGIAQLAGIATTK